MAPTGQPGRLTLGLGAAGDGVPVVVGMRAGQPGRFGLGVAGDGVPVVVGMRAGQPGRFGLGVAAAGVRSGPPEGGP